MLARLLENDTNTAKGDDVMPGLVLFTVPTPETKVSGPLGV